MLRKMPGDVTQVLENTQRDERPVLGVLCAFIWGPQINILGILVRLYRAELITEHFGQFDIEMYTHTYVHTGMYGKLQRYWRPSWDIKKSNQMKWHSAHANSQQEKQAGVEVPAKPETLLWAAKCIHSETSARPAQARVRIHCSKLWVMPSPELKMLLKTAVVKSKDFLLFPELFFPNWHRRELFERWFCQQTNQQKVQLHALGA